MKTRNKIFSALGVLIVIGVSALMITLAYESPCPQAPTLALGTESMRAVTLRCYGSPGEVLAVERIAKPRPADGEVLIKVRAASVNPSEWHMVTGKPYILRFEHGHRCAAWNSAWATTWPAPWKPWARTSRVSKPGDEVFGGAGGALAEYVIAREDGDIVAKPPEMSFEEAAAMPIAGDHRAAGPCAITVTSPPGRRCSSTAPPAASAHTPCRSPRRSAPR